MDAPPLLPILRSELQGRLLALLADDPSMAFGVRELAERAGTSPTTAQREVERAEQAGIVISTRQGSQRLVRMNENHPLYQPLRQILLATFGVPELIRREFKDVPGLDRLLIFGSWAARFKGIRGSEPHDLDVLLVGDGIDREAAHEAADRAERALRKPVQVTIRSRAAWDEGSRNPFLATVLSRPFLVVFEPGGDS